MKEELVKLIECVVSQLWQASDFEAAIHEVLAMIGAQFSADSAFFTEFSTDTNTYKNSYVWFDGDDKTAAKQRMLAFHCFDEIKAFADSQDIVYWCQDNSPENTDNPFKSSGSRSVLISLINQDSLCACFGLSDKAERRDDWAQQNDLQNAVSTLSKIISALLLKTEYAKRSEQTQQRLKASLHASEQRADTAYELLDSISAGVIIVDLYPDGTAHPQYGNLGLYRMLRIPRTAENAVVPDRSVAELESTYFDDFFANIPEPDYSKVRKEFKAGFSTNHFTVKKYRLLRGDGTYVWVTADLSLRKANAAYRTYYATYTDMSEEQSLQSGLMEMLEKQKDISSRLENAIRAKSDFLSRMSHDIRTPMNAIMGMTTIACTHIDNSNRVMDCLDKISISSKLLLSIINEVLDMSKVESGYFALAEEDVDLAELIQGVITMVQPEIDSKDLTFEVHINNVIHEKVISDMQRLQQVLVNLLSNAVKYNSDGGKVSLDIYEKPSDLPGHAHYQFVVTDNGIGIAPQFLTRIFEPFERAEDERIKTIQGTGLGLSICKTIAELMDGDIHVESEWGKGSRFTATLNLQIQPELIDSHVLDGLHVLIADDDEIICRNTSERLKDLGVTVEWVLNGYAAIEKIVNAHHADNDYFAVIIDYKMPGIDGMQTAHLIREAVGCGMPIIMISAYDLSDQIDYLQDAGANDFIFKPLFRSRLISKIKQYLQGEKFTPPIVKTPSNALYSGRRILLVEDNEINREIAVELLVDTGVTVDTAENGKKAVEMVAASPEGYYQLIFMDIQMPIMDGCAATVAIRALNRGDTKALPIIAMTANAFADDRERTRAAGMNDHLAKPIDMAQFYQVLHRFLS